MRLGHIVGNGVDRVRNWPIYRSTAGSGAFLRSTLQKQPLKHQKLVFDMFQDIYYLCSNFSVDFVRFCRPGEANCDMGLGGLPQSTWVGRLLPQYAPKTAAKAPETISIRLTTLMLSLPLLFCVFYSIFDVKRRVLRCAAVYCGFQACPMNRAHHRVATCPAFGGTSRFLALVSRVPSPTSAGRQLSRFLVVPCPSCRPLPLHHSKARVSQ